MATYTPKKTIHYSSWQARRHVHIYHAPLTTDVTHSTVAAEKAPAPKPDTPTK